MPVHPARRLGVAALLGVVGLLEVGLVFEAIRSSLPSELPSSFETPGLNLPSRSIGGLVESYLVIIGVLTLLFVGLAALTSDSDPLEWVRGEGTHRVDPLLAVEASLLSVGLPGTVDTLLLGSAGWVPGGAPVGVIALLFGVIPLLGVALGLAAIWRAQESDSIV